VPVSELGRFLSAEELRRLGGLQVLAREVVEGFCAGLHQSPHRGFSVEFRQHRAYVAGDEIRSIDWRVFGRTDRFYVREYEEETNLRAQLLVDVSGSMGYGPAGKAKWQYAVQLAACLAHLMIRQQDSVGLVTFDSGIRRVLPPRARPSHLQAILTELEGAKTGGESDLGSVFRAVLPKLQRRGLLVLISDCFGEVQPLLRALAQLRHGHQEVLVFQVLDRDELEFPFREWTQFECLERPGTARLLDPAQVRGVYLERLEAFRTELRRGCRRHRVDLVEMTTESPLTEALAVYFKRRMQHR
jgi:uncharacterized protein (DUF58 family)